MNDQSIIDKIKEAHSLGMEPAFAYERISDEVQKNGISLAYQEGEAHRYAKEKNLYIIRSFQKIESAHSEGRKVFNDMLDAAIIYGVKHLIFKSTDRMSRNYRDLDKIEKMIEAHDIKVHLYQRNEVIDKYSDHNTKMILGIELVVSKQASDKISHDVKEHNRFKAKRGIAPFRPPVGYVYDPNSKSHIIDKKYESTVRYIFDAFDSRKWALRELVSHLNENGYTPRKGKWTLSSLHHMLTNVFYYGSFMYENTECRGTHEPYITKDRFVERMKVLGERFHGFKKRADDLVVFNKIFVCSCGRMLTGEIKKNKFIYYGHQCDHTNKRIFLREERILEMLDKKIQSVSFSPKFSDYLKAIFKKIVDVKKENTSQERAGISRRIAELEKKQGRLLDLWAEGVIDRDALARQMDIYKHEIEALNKRRVISGQDANKALFKISEIIDLLKNMPQIYLSSPKQGKAEIIRTMVEKIVLDGNSVNILWLRPYSFLLIPEILEEKERTVSVRNCPIMLPR